MTPREKLKSTFVRSRPWLGMLCALGIGFSLGVPVGGVFTLKLIRNYGHDLGALAIEYGLLLANATTPDAIQWEIRNRGAEVFSPDYETSLKTALPIAESERQEVKARGSKPQVKTARR